MRTTTRCFFCLVLAASVFPGCSRTAAVNSASSQQQKPNSQAVAPAGLQSGDAVPTVTGSVVETMDTSNYTYVRVKSETGEVWAATGQFKVAVGDRVVVPLESPMTNFHSQTLNRDFPLIYFVSQIRREGEPPVPLAIAHEQAGGHAPAPQVQEKIDPAPGGTTVANVWANRASLAGKTVTVRGKVVKFNGGILDRNWIHVQDGTGDAKEGTNDLTVTTPMSADRVKPGDVITATGTVVVDKDFGSGYSYKVMLEKSTLVLK